jgi:hypothetical protein
MKKILWFNVDNYETAISITWVDKGGIFNKIVLSNDEDSDTLTILCPRCHKNIITMRFYEDRVENCMGLNINPYQETICMYCLEKDIEALGESRNNYPSCISMYEESCENKDCKFYCEVCIDALGVFCEHYKPRTKFKEDF